MAELGAASPHIDRTIGATAAVLKVLDAVHGLQPSLHQDGAGDFPGYLSELCRLEEDNSGLASPSGSPTSSSTSVSTTSPTVLPRRPRDLADLHFLAKPCFLAVVGVALQKLKKTSGFLDVGARLLSRSPQLEAYFRFDWSNIYFFESTVPSC